MRRALRWLLGALAAMLASGAVAQTVSPAPDSVAVTIYRAPDRAADSPINRSWLQGYALITEHRRVAIPAGRTTLRFEGVAAGILAESAIVTGLPKGVREKNLDADLLSPRSLFAASFGRPVTIRRTIAKKTIEEPAILRSGPDGAAIVQTREGFVAVDCGPGSETLAYDGVPPGLSAKPTLSVELESPSATTVTLTLSYLAWGFDWQANYVATMRPDGQSADLIAWVTLASSDTTSFVDAETMVVAGKIEREDSAPYSDAEEGAQALTFTCFAHPPAAPPPPPPPPPPAPVALSVESAMDIIVTGSRRKPRLVEQEDLGDLKLYRVPDRTTVAALAQKQVALLDRDAVPARVVYLAEMYDNGEADAVQLALRMTNRTDAGLGVPLPAGPVALFAPRTVVGAGTPLLIGEGALPDKAIGEEVEVKLAEASQVTIDSERPASGKHWKDYVETARNANPWPVSFEARFSAEDFARMSRLSEKTVRKQGRMVWAVTIPANGERRLAYRIRDQD